MLHRYSPFADEPVDCVLWIASERIEANDYNPNVMAPVEKRLLQRSLASDGYTQPVVAVAQGERYVVIDGFHRYLLGRKNGALRQRLQGYLPVTLLVSASEDTASRIAATIRHNRARGKHQIASMSDIVRDLHRLAGMRSASAQSWEWTPMRCYGSSRSAGWRSCLLTRTTVRDGR